MSNLAPDRAGRQQTRGRTANNEARVSPNLAGLPWNSLNHQVLGNPQAGSLQFTSSASQVEKKHGTTAVTVERHMSERSGGFQYNMDETTKLSKELRNMSTGKASFIQATLNFSQSTIALGSTAAELTLVSVDGLVAGDKVYGKWHAGTLYEYEEERLVKNIDVTGKKVKLQAAFSKAPEASTLLKRAIRVEFIEQGADYYDLTHNLKMTGDDGSVHILHTESCVVGTGTNIAGSNSQLMGSGLQFTVNATEHELPNGERVPKFNEEYDISANVARGINP